jgi:hypothetical protein
MNSESDEVISFMSEQTTTQINFNEALNILNNISKESFSSDVWIPSLKRSVKIQEITAKQQKTLIESAIDSTVLKSTFSKYFYEIVCSNCSEDKEIVEKFTTIDKHSIAFSMRYQISDKIKVLFQEEPKIESDVNISDVLNNFKEYTHPEAEIINFSKNSVELEVLIDIPTFSEESKFDSYIYGKEKKSDEVEEIKNIITGAFLGETSKYIRQVKLNGTDFDYQSMHIPQKIQFVEKLPAALVQNILEKVVKWRGEINNLSTVKYEEVSKIIEVDSMLFVGS